MSRDGEAECRVAFAQLRARFDVDLDVTLEFVPRKHLRGNFGLTTQEGEVYRIQIARLPCATCMVDTMIHEFAHILVRDDDGDMEEHHPPEYWMMLGEAVCEVYGMV